MSSGHNLNTPEGNKFVSSSGLFSNYDSRMSRHRISSNSNNSLSNRFSNRSSSKVTMLNSDENYMSKYTVSSTENEMPSPLRAGVSPLMSSPLSYSKRFNINAQSNLSSSPGRLNRSTVSSLIERNSPSKPYSASNSFARMNLSCEEKCPSTFAGRMITVANQMENDQFPWVSFNGSIPMNLSNSLVPSPVSKVNSPSAEASSSFKTRVRVRLSKPNNSDASIMGSTIDSSSNMNESSTTKSVIQVLKEIARKRCLVIDNEDHEGPPQAKRRPEHNLYLSRPEEETEEPVPALQTRVNGEEERAKRTREPDWDSTNVSKCKRPRNNYNFVNNEIISSLSSSIGLHVFKHSDRRRSMRKSIAIQVQTLVPEEKKEERKQQVQTSIQPPSSPPKTKDTGMLTDPIPEPMPRPPVKEKVLSDVNGMLKSALSKFDIQPSMSTTKETDNITDVPLGSLNPTVPLAQSKVSVAASPSTEISSTLSLSNQTITSPPTNIETASSSSVNLMTSKNTSAPESSSIAFMPPVSTTQLSFGMSTVLSSKPLEIPKLIEKEVEKQESLTNTNQDQKEFKLKTENASKSESPFNFGVSQPNANLKPPVSLPQTSTSGLFDFKAPATLSSVQVPHTSTPVFNFATQKLQESVNKSEETKTVTNENQTVFGSALNATPVTSMLLSQKNDTSPATDNNSLANKNEILKPISSGFTFQSKPVVSTEEEKKEIASSEIFSFSKLDNKVVSSNNNISDSKPFQFGSGGFTFGKTNKENEEIQKNTVTTTNTSVIQPIFSFSSSAVKKDEKPGGFTFNAPVSTTTSEQKGLFTLNASSTAVTSTAPSLFGSTTSAASTKPVIPNSLFGTNLENTNTLTSTTTTTNNTSAISNPSNGSVITFGNVASKPTLGNATTSKPLFGSSSNPPSFGSTINNTSLFGGNITKTETSKLPTFGGSTSSTNTVNPTTFSLGVASTSSTIPTFGSVASGNNNPTFGSTATGSTNQPVFGSTATGTLNTSTFGGTKTTSASVSTFGSALTGRTDSGTFGSTTTSGTTTQLFGAPSAGTSTPVFGGTANNNPPVFGGTTSNNSPAFGSTPVFGGTGSGTTFGATASSSGFGSSTLTSPTFGNQPQPSFGNQAGTSFGGTSAFGQASSTPTFGTQNTFGNQTTSTPTFGSTSAFGSSTSTFGSSSVPASAPAFGTTNTPAFGSSTTFGSQETNKPFTFNAPATQPVQAGTFGFSTPQQQQGSGSLFQFGSSSTNAPSTQPFQFNASQSSTSVGGTSQQMFSIGSGSTAPVRRMRRKK